jgi:hypothetical protein
LFGSKKRKHAAWAVTVQEKKTSALIVANPKRKIQINKKQDINVLFLFARRCHKALPNRDNSSSLSDVTAPQHHHDGVSSISDSYTLL